MNQNGTWSYEKGKEGTDVATVRKTHLGHQAARKEEVIRTPTAREKAKAHGRPIFLERKKKDRWNGVTRVLGTFVFRLGGAKKATVILSCGKKKSRLPRGSGMDRGSITWTNLKRSEEEKRFRTGITEKRKALLLRKGRKESQAKKRAMYC